jgi:immune inhibitor A
VQRKRSITLLIAGLSLVVCCCVVVVGTSAFFIARSASKGGGWSWTWNTSSSEPEPTPDPALFQRQPTAEEIATAERVAQVRLPRRDLIDLAQRLGRKSLTAHETASPVYELDDRLGFWVHDQETSSYFTATATLEYATPHAYWWVEEGYEVPPEDLESSAQGFETHTYPTNRRLFGNEPSPGVDGDQHVYIFLGRVPGVGGYFSSSDAFPAAVSEYSNEHEMFYINLENAMPGGSYFDGILAHELQHMSQWAQDRNEDTWANEGLSEVAIQVNGYATGAPDRSYSSLPDTQLTNWPELEDSDAHYGASFLFMSYFLDRYGEEKLHSLAVDQENGLAGLDSVLGAQDGAERPSLALFADWAVANYLDDPGVDRGQYGYKDLDPASPDPVAHLSAYPVRQDAAVHQFGVDYVEIEGAGDVTVSFTGSLIVPLVGCQPHSGGYFWWSNRGDDSDVLLTRAFDLTGIEQATLTAWTWYSLETDYDYAYVEVSTDAGKTWDLLASADTTTVNPMGASYGPALNGLSGSGAKPRWVEQRFDLTRYVGQSVLVRFEVIYDDAVNYPGLCLDDISIPELAFTDGAEQDDTGWDSQGWVRATGNIPQDFVVQLITFGGETQVSRLALDGARHGAVQIDGLGANVDRAVLVISGIAPSTTEWAGYRYEVIAR